MKQKTKSVFSIGRVEALSDGIFAIIVTLLVLELKVPHLDSPTSSQELLEALVALVPKFTSWVISFFTVCVIWVNHHRLFKIFKEIDDGIFWLNALLLLFVSFIPFPTALLGDYIDNKVATALYGIVFGLMSLTFVFMRMYVFRKTGIIDEEKHTNFRKKTVVAFLMGPTPYFVAAALSWAHPTISLVLYLIMPIYFTVTFSTASVTQEEQAA